MNDIQQKINDLRWLYAMGVTYYCIKGKKDATAISNIEVANQINKDITSLPYSTQKFTTANNSQVSMMDLNMSAIQLARNLADSSNNLEELKANLLTFEGCNLKKFANNTVFGDGNSTASIMFIGEAPGASEDAMGIPFCGESGKLLDNMLYSIKVSRTTNAYITNTVFWRPPANRPPTQEEIDICRPFVEKHISLINPKLIILVGSTAATSLFGKHAGITKIRQEYYSYSNKYLSTPIPTIAMFHPAYLLRQPLQKKNAWYDLLKIQQFITENM